jgi:hypothetical protein
MKTEMSSRERVLAAMSRKPVDHVPCAPFTTPQDWPQRIGKTWRYPFGPSVPETLDYLVGTLGVDQTVTCSWGYYPEAGVSSRAWMDGGIIHKTYATPSGEMHASVRYDGHWPHGLDIPFFSDYNSSHYVEPWVKTRRDVDCLRHILLPPRSRDEMEEVRFRFTETSRLAANHGLATIFYFGLGLTGALQMFGAESMCLLAASEPELIDDYLGVDHQWNLRNYEIALDLGFDMIRRNGFYETCDFFSPRMLDRFLGRRLAEEIKLVHQAGRIIGYTLLTGVVPMLDNLSRLDFDCIVCPDIFMKGMDGPAIAGKLKKTSFWTGPSDTIHMPWPATEKVREAVRYVFDVFGKTGLLITPCSASKAVFPWENVLAMIDEWKKLR